MNVCTFAGNVVADPDIRGEGDRRFARLRLAVNNRKKDGDKWVDETLWIGVTLFGRFVGLAERFVTKGTKVAVSGRLSLREYQDKTGTTKSSLDLVADSFDPFIGGKSEGGGQRQASGGGKPSGGHAQHDDDIPF